jgi:hypothetical protein
MCLGLAARYVSRLPAIETVKEEAIRTWDSWNFRHSGLNSSSIMFNG